MTRPNDPAPDTRRVLLVEDNVDNARLMRLLLGRAGFDVRTAHDGPAALAAAAEFRPEVVLLDLRLPGQDGYEVAEALRALPATAGARILAVTGRNDRDLPPSFDGLVLKPVDFVALIERIGRPPGDDPAGPS